MAYVPVACGNEFTRKILEAIGITGPARDVVIRLPLNGIITVEVERLVDTDEAKRMVEVFALCRAEKIDEFPEPVT